MRILCGIHSLGGGGAERVMAGLASRLSRAGHSVTLMTLDRGEDDRYEVDPEVHRVYLDVMRESRGWVERIWWNLDRLRRIRKTVRRIQPEVVLSFCDRTNVTILFSLWGTPFPIVVAERSDPSMQKLSPLWERLRRWSYPRAARVVALTPASAKALAEHSPQRIVEIPSAVESPVAARDHRVADAGRRILGVGRFEYEKGFDRIIRVFGNVLASRTDVSNPPWTLRLVGSGSQQEELRRQCEAQGISSRVEFVPWLPTVAPEYLAASIFVLPSRYEGFPSSLMEAMSFGVPSIAVDCESGPRAIVQSEAEAILVDNTEPALAAELGRLMDDPSLRERLARNAGIVSSRFSWSRMTAAYQDVLVEASKTIR